MYIKYVLCHRIWTFYLISFVLQNYRVLFTIYKTKCSHSFNSSVISSHSSLWGVPGFLPEFRPCPCPSFLLSLLTSWEDSQPCPWLQLRIQWTFLWMPRFPVLLNELFLQRQAVLAANKPEVSALSRKFLSAEESYFTQGQAFAWAVGTDCRVMRECKGPLPSLCHPNYRAPPGVSGSLFWVYTAYMFSHYPTL